MRNRLAFTPGKPIVPGQPLGRYLPPVSPDIAPAWLRQHASPGAWVLDPFGAAPGAAVEIARQGYRLLVAANNPIARFLLERYANPFTENEFKAALDVLASSQVGSERLEPELRQLYQTHCDQCGKSIDATSFVWDRETNAIISRTYTCPYCKDSGERLAGVGDQGRANPANMGMHRARALERVASLHDPDREHAEEALAMYTPRAVFALFTLVNKLDSLAPIYRGPLQALLLYAFDQGSSLWPHPPSRTRPRQLSTPGRFREKNIWLALEEGISAWSQGAAGSTDPPGRIPVTTWPELPPGNGGICIFEGRLKDLANQFSAGSSGIEFAAAAGVLPRPNQAYWTLSALWAGWLWGKEATAPFKSVLRRRRYDWGWHITALQSTFEGMGRLLHAGTPYLGLIGENEAGFLAAAISAAEMSGITLDDLAMRERSASGPDHAQVVWRVSKDSVSARPELTKAEIQAIALEGIIHHLCECGEPANYLRLKAAVLSSLAHKYPFELKAGDRPAERLDALLAAIRPSFIHPQLHRYGGSAGSLESGDWWLADSSKTDIQIPISDRIEMALVRLLLQENGIRLAELDGFLCRQFPGLLTPDLTLILECLKSYALAQDDAWFLREQELPKARRQDIEEAKTLLLMTGERLGFRAESYAAGEGRPGLVTWRRKGGALDYLFHVQASAIFNPILPLWNSEMPQLAFQAESSARKLIVIPGSRAGLALYKLRTNPYLRQEIELHWQVIKFRHLHWLSKHENLSSSNLDELFRLDPLENSDAQMKLL
jgi:hypothetical protein